MKSLGDAKKSGKGQDKSSIKAGIIGESVKKCFLEFSKNL